MQGGKPARDPWENRRCETSTFARTGNVGMCSINLKELRVFSEVEYQFCSKKTRPYGKVAWCRHLKAGAIFADDTRVCNEAFTHGLPDQLSEKVALSKAAGIHRREKEGNSCRIGVHQFGTSNL